MLTLTKNLSTLRVIPSEDKENVTISLRSEHEGQLLGNLTHVLTTGEAIELASALMKLVGPRKEDTRTVEEKVNDRIFDYMTDTEKVEALIEGVDTTNVEDLKYTKTLLEAIPNFQEIKNNLLDKLKNEN